MNFDFSMILLIHVDSDETNKLLIHWLEFVCIVVQHCLYLHAISLQAGLSLKIFAVTADKLSYFENLL